MFGQQKKDLTTEVHELRLLVLAHEERRSKTAEAERVRRAKLEDAVASIKEIKSAGGTFGADNMSKLLVALEEWLA